MALPVRDRYRASSDISTKYPSDVDANGFFIGHPESEVEQIVDLGRQNSKAYSVGTIVFCSSLPAGLVLECTTEGTTATTEPSFSGATEGGTKTDGTAGWTYKKLVPDLSTYAKLASPTFTGTPKAPTASAGTNTTQIATTAFVQSAVSGVSAGANTSLSNLTTTGEKHFLTNGYTYVYPNGGSASSPANITVNSRYVLSNPFSGYQIRAVAEIKVNDKWGEVQNFVYPATSGSAYGVMASVYDGGIVVQTASTGLCGRSSYDGNPFGATTATTTAPCRVRVWKVGV